MMAELIARYPWLWTLVWQSTLCLAAGLGGSYLLRRQAARAHQIVLLGLIATALIPAVSEIVQRNQWGLFVAERAVPAPRQDLPALQNDPITPVPPIAGEVMESASAAESPRTASAPAAVGFRWTEAILLLWLAASGVLLLRLVGLFLLGRRVVARSALIDEPRITGAIAVVRGRLAIQADVAVRADSCVRSPVIWCWGRRPILLVPEGSYRDNEGLDWVSILCHELAHWKRRDHIHGLFAELLACALPWQPLTWWARHRLVALSEEACDDWVIASGQASTSYARTLLGLIPQGQTAVVPGVVTDRRRLAGRVRRILEDGCANPYLGLKWTLAIMTLVGCISLGIGFAQTRPAPMNQAVQDTQMRTEPPSTHQDETTVNEETILLRIVDPNGQPVSDASVCVPIRGLLAVTYDPVRLSPGASDRNGLFVLGMSGLFAEQRGKAIIYVLHEGRRIGAVQGIVRGDLSRELRITLVPVCRVYGTLDSAGLAALGLPLRDASISIRSNTDGLFVRLLREQKRSFEFLLPPGEFAMDIHGSGSHSESWAAIRAEIEHKTYPVSISQGQRNLDLGVIDLRPTNLSTLIGQPAPEIGPMREWKNGSAVTLAQLRGQVVWLHFGGRVPVRWPYLSPLTETIESLGDKAPMVIAIYNCASLAELEQKRTESRERFGDVPEIPFRIAIDGGEPTFDEGTDEPRPGATYSRYGVTIPTDVLIDPRGNVVGQPGPDPRGVKDAILEMLGLPRPSLLPAPTWRQRFYAAYRLGGGEILKRIAPPFIPERMEYYRAEGGRHPNGPDQLTFHWDGRLRRWGMLVGLGRPNTLGGILQDVLGLQSGDYDGPKSLLDIELPGDWIIRNEASQEVKLQALEGLLAEEFGRRIRFERRMEQAAIWYVTEQTDR